MGSSRQRWAARLISAAVALALICGCAIGAYAHAVGHCHSGDAHVVQQEGAETSASNVTADSQHQGESQKAPVPGDHAQCCDTFCHGGFAIVDISTVVLLLPRFMLAARFVQLAAGTQPHSPERPPRSPVLA